VKGEAKVTLRKPIASVCHVTPHCEHVTFCVKLGKSATETPEMLCETFGKHSLSWTAVFEWHSHFKAGQMSVEYNKH
jgi:hypothetical protein